MNDLDLEDYRERSDRYWRAKFIRAIGSSIGTAMQRVIFLNGVMSVIAVAIMWGRRLEALPEEALHLQRIAKQARDSFAELRRAVVDERTLESLMLHIKADSVFRQKRSDEKFDFAAVARYLGAFAECTDELVNEAPRRRGPPDTFALTVSAAIAKAYWEAFEQWPGGGRRWKNARETPYHRICDVVEYPRRRCLTLLATLLWIWPVSWHRDGDRCRSGLVYSTMLIPKLTVEVGSLKML